MNTNFPEALDNVKVTPEAVEAEIVSEFYFTVGDGIRGESNMGTKPASATGWDQVTICALILKNRTKIIGINYGPVSRANFDAELARSLARRAAVDQIWPLLGFRLRDAVTALSP